MREHARALTGFRNDWDDGVGPNNFRFDPEYHDFGVKRIFGKKGRFEWRDSCEMCLAHPSHPSFFVRSCGPTSSPCRPAARRAGRCSRCTSADTTRCALLWRRFCAAPSFTRVRAW